MNKISCFSFACNKEEKLCKAIRRDREKNKENHRRDKEWEEGTFSKQRVEHR